RDGLPRSEAQPPIRAITATATARLTNSSRRTAGGAPPIAGIPLNSLGGTVGCTAQALERDRVTIVAIPRRGYLPEEKDDLAEDVRLSPPPLTGAMGRPVVACPGNRGSRRASP
ncbi:MAG: hypothetical protein WCA32_01755, partial [Chromatiaceae bacterium]